MQEHMLNNAPSAQTVAAQAETVETAMRLRQRLVRSVQRGFTMVEMMITLAIIAILATLLATQFSGDGSKATKLLADMTTIKGAMLRMQADTGGIPENLTALWVRDNANTDNMFNGIAVTNTWAGPYLENVPVTGATINADEIAEGARISSEREAASADNAGQMRWVYFLHATDIPRGVIEELLKKCNGNDNLNATFATGKCRSTVDGDAEIGTIDLRVADSR